MSYWHHVDGYIKFDGYVGSNHYYKEVDPDKSQQKFDQFTNYLLANNYQLDKSREGLPSWSCCASLERSELWSDGEHTLLINLINSTSSDKPSVEMSYLGSCSRVFKSEKEQQAIMTAFIACKYSHNKNNFTAEEKESFLSRSIQLDSNYSDPTTIRIRSTNDGNRYLVTIKSLGGEQEFFYFLKKDDGSVKGLLSYQDILLDNGQAGNYPISCAALQKAIKLLIMSWMIF